MSPLVVCAVLSLFRGSLTSATEVLVLVLLVVALAATGERLAGLVAALSSGVWFDLFLTEPHGRFTIAKADDIEITVLLVAIGLVALPRELRRRMHLDEPGAQLEMTEREDGVIEVRAQMAVPVTQSWFWAKEWQEREREADADIAAGRLTRYEDAESFLDALPD